MDDFTLRVTPGADRAEPSATNAVEKDLCKDATRRVSGAQKQDVVDPRFGHLLPLLGAPARRAASPGGATKKNAVAVIAPAA
jgi:hypothetical protein